MQRALHGEIRRQGTGPGVVFSAGGDGGVGALAGEGDGVVSGGFAVSDRLRDAAGVRFDGSRRLLLPATRTSDISQQTPPNCGLDGA